MPCREFTRGSLKKGNKGALHTVNNTRVMLPVTVRHLSTVVRDSGLAHTNATATFRWHALRLHNWSAKVQLQRFCKSANVLCTTSCTGGFQVASRRCTSCSEASVRPRGNSEAPRHQTEAVTKHDSILPLSDSPPLTSPKGDPEDLQHPKGRFPEPAATKRTRKRRKQRGD